jgi:GT2 family glycosyltransferase
MSTKEKTQNKYIKKTKQVLKNEGPLSLIKMTFLFGVRHTPLNKLMPNPPVYHINPDDVKKWYKRYSKAVTIVIPSYNDVPLLKQCLQSIEATTKFKKVKVIIVDDYCQQENSARLRQLEDENVKVLFRKSNGGFAKAVNTGMKAVKTGDVILLNSDTIAKSGWLESLQFAARKYDPKIGIAGPKLLYKNGTIQSAGSFHYKNKPEWFDHYYKTQPGKLGVANVPEHVIGVTGACMYIKREVIDKIGYFDEKFGMAFEDMDYCLRAWKAGFRSFYVPTSKLIHLESATRGKVQGKREKDSQAYFWSKWHNFFYKRNVTAKNGKLRIIYVLNDTGLAGGIRMVFEHLNKLQERGHEVELYSLGKDPEWFDLKVPHRSFKSYEDLCEKLAKQDAIKVATWWETGKWVWLGSINKGVPVFYVQDVEDSYYKDDKVMRDTVIAGYKPEFNYLTISINNQETLSKLGRDSTNITCGIDAKTFFVEKNTKREDDVLIAIGRKHYLKNFAMTFKAWKNMKDKPKLTLFGYEPDVVEKDPLITYHYIPTDEAINTMLNKATVFVQSSKHEGFCLPPLEAMAAGVPVIMTDSNGNRDFMEPGKNCILVEQDNSKQLTIELERLFKDKKLQEKLRKNGFKTAAEYDWPVIINKLEMFYNRLANEAKKENSKIPVL